LIPGQSISTEQKPQAEVVVEGELSPFEDEALYRILRKSFRIDHPSYTELLDEDVATRVNVIFHYPYAKTLFTEVLQENWRDLKELFKQVSHRRGRAGAAFTFKFIAPENQLVFKSGVVGEREVASALDQIGHLTGVVGQMVRPETMQEPIETIEAVFDKKSDRWHGFRGFGPDQNYVFDDSLFRWVPVVKDQK
jgi:hypothetical protein